MDVVDNGYIIKRSGTMRKGSHCIVIDCANTEADENLSYFTLPTSRVSAKKLNEKKMKLTSKTGLTASPTKRLPARQLKSPPPKIQLKAIARPAPFVLKPFAGLYNPYPYGCSLLCNHPTDTEAKKLLRKAKETWAHEGKNLLLAEEIEAIRAGLQEYNYAKEKTPKNIGLFTQVESVPEELFRQYTETDSRPLTPAPTLASAATKASGSRRCVTPDPFPTNQVREKTLLILDLRRSHSQETLSYYGSSSLQEPPLIRIQHVHTRIGSLEETRTETHYSVKSLHSLPVTSNKGARNNNTKKTINIATDVEQEPHKDKTETATDGNDADEEDNEEFIKRRGKKKKKKGRDESRGPPAFQASLDPETQVAAIGDESHNPSARPSLVPGNTSQETQEPVGTKKYSIKQSKSLDIDSYLDKEILRHLRRELNEEIVDTELNDKRRKALEEALKAISKDRTDCDELVNLQKELKIPPVNTNLWISLPRTFTRSSARFELPMDSRTLTNMTPIKYLREHVSITSARKLLYNCIFNKFKMEADLENEHERKLHGQVLQSALDLMMGRPMSESQAVYFKNLIGWKEEHVFDFKTFCGICALSERLLAPEYCPQNPDRKSDPCHEIETADFEMLSRKLNGQSVDENLITILNGIKTL